MAEEANMIALALKGVTENPVVSYTTGILSTLGIMALASRWLRKDKFDASLDQKASELIKTYGARVDALEKSREEAWSKLNEQQGEIAILKGQLHSLRSENDALRAENQRLHAQIDKQTVELRELEMKAAGQSSTIERLETKVRRLEMNGAAAKPIAGGRRESDPKA